jgi:hypothetical protein
VGGRRTAATRHGTGSAGQLASATSGSSTAGDTNIRPDDPSPRATAVDGDGRGIIFLSRAAIARNDGLASAHGDTAMAQRVTMMTPCVSSLVKL